MVSELLSMNMADRTLSQRAIVRVEPLIIPIRGEKVIIDSDLARIYGVTTRRLNEQVKRNIDRFPPDFMFRLRPREFGALMSQFATSKSGRGGRRKLPYAFTEHGAIMAANVLNSRRAVQMSVYVVRAFVHLRSRLWENRELARRLLELERKVEYQGGELHELFDAFRRLMAVPEKPKRPIGFQLRRVSRPNLSTGWETRCITLSYILLYNFLLRGSSTHYFHTRLLTTQITLLLVFT